MMTTNLFVIVNVKQLRTGGSFRIFFRTSWDVGFLNSAIFNSFHNRVESGTILEGLQNFSRGVCVCVCLNTPPSPCVHHCFTISILVEVLWGFCPFSRVQLEWDSKCTEIKLHFAGKWKGPHNSVGWQISRLAAVAVVWCTGYPLPSPLSLSLPLPHATASEVVLNGFYSDLLPQR